MNDLVRHGGELPDRRGKAQDQATSALSVDSVSWTGGPLPSFSDMGAAKPRLGGRELHSVVIDEGLVRRRREPSGDRYHRRRLGWVATTAGVVLIRSEQELRPDARGRMRPDGAFVAAAPEHVVIVGAPQRRVGDIADESQGSSAPSTSPSAGGAGHEARPKGYWRDSPFAPAVVRQGLTRLIAEPELQVAQAVSFDDGARHSVSLLVMDRLRLAVVECSLLRGATHWQTEQLTFEIRGSGERVGSGSRRGELRG